MSASVSEPSNPPAMQSPSTNHAKSPRQTRRQRASTTTARDVVMASRAAGMSIAECAKAASISLRTASNYVRDIERDGDDISRERIISMLSRRLSPGADTPDQYIAPLVAILSKLKGWTDRDSVRETVQPIGTLFASWAAETKRETIETVRETEGGTPLASAGGPNAGEPPTESVNGSVKLSPTPPQKF